MTEAAAGVDITPKVVPMAVHTPWATVVVYGHEFMSKRDVQVLATCLTKLPQFCAEDHGIRSVTFRDDDFPVSKFGKPILASCFPDNGGIIINLQAVFRRAVEHALEDTNKSIFAAFHQLMIQNYLHESYHLSIRLDAERRRDTDALIAKSAEAQLKEERKAEVFSLDMLFDLVKRADLEPGHHAENPFLASQLMTLLGAKDDVWSKKQRRMLQDRIFYKLDQEPGCPGLDVDTFKGFCRLLSKEKGEEAEKVWNQRTILGVGQAQDTAELIREVSTIIPAEEAPIGPTTATPNAAAGDIPAAIAAMMAEPAPKQENPNEGWSEWDDGGMEDSKPATSSTEPQVLVNSIVETDQRQTSGTAKFCSFCGGSGFPVGAKFCHHCQQPLPGTVPATGMAPSAPSQAGPVVKSLPETGLGPEQTGITARAVYSKVYEHIFNNCGHSPGTGDVGFTRPEGCTETAIPLTDAEKAVVPYMDCLDVNGRFCGKASTENGLRGYITKNFKLPAYKLYLNDNGVLRERLLLPQNPAKRNQNGEYSKPAMQARAGTMIMYVMEANDAVAKQTGKKFYPKCVDGVWGD